MALQIINQNSAFEEFKTVPTKESDPRSKFKQLKTHSKWKPSNCRAEYVKDFEFYCFWNFAFFIQNFKFLIDIHGPGYEVY